MSAVQSYSGLAIIPAGSPGPGVMMPVVPPGFRLHAKSFHVASVGLNAVNVSAVDSLSVGALATVGGGSIVAGVGNVASLVPGPIDWWVAPGETPTIFLSPGTTTDDVNVVIEGELEVA